MKKIVLLVASLCILAGCGSATPEQADTPAVAVQTPTATPWPVLGYAVAQGNTPMLYTADFAAQWGGTDGKTLNLDDYGEVDAVEHVAFADTVFTIHENTTDDVVRVTTDDYPFTRIKGLFVHKKFLGEITPTKPANREKIALSADTILQNLKSAEGEDYVWGGNSPEGVEKLLQFFPPQEEISQELAKQWQLKGMDCSGLLYWATGGITPRNTSALVTFGKSLPIEGKTLAEIIPMLQPLDVIVWKGHMMIVFDDKNTIESAYQYGKKEDGEDFNGGVRIRPFEESLAEVFEKRIAANDYNDPKFADEKPFVINRWIAQ